MVSPLCVYVLSSSYEDTSPFLLSRAARVRTVRNEGESGGVKSIVTVGSQADPHVGYWAGIKIVVKISITSDMQMTPPLWQKVKRN